MMPQEEDDLRLWIDTRFRLGDAYWRDFNERRSYEWKVNFGLWAALFSFAAIVAKGDLSLSSMLGSLITVIIIVVFLVYWLLWLPGLRRRNFKNLKNAYDEWNAVREKLKIPFKATEDEPKLTRPIAVWIHWAHGSQLIVTLLFATAALVAIWLQRSGCNP